MSSKYILLAIVLLMAGLESGKAQDFPSPRELIDAANSAIDLLPLRPYALRATLVAQGITAGVKTKGHLTVFQDQDRSRTELEFGSYRELRVVLGNHGYVTRNASSRPVQLHEMPETLQWWSVDLARSDELGQVFTKVTGGLPSNCVEVTQAQIEDENSRPASPREIVRYCFDAEKKVLLERASNRGLRGDPTWETHYLDYQAIGGVQFPGAIRHFAQGNSAGVDFEDIQVSTLNPNSVDFAIPKNATEFETCDHPQPTRMLKRVEPAYPQMAKIAHVQGDVRFSVVIGTDGALENIKAISGHPILVQAALEALKRWQYSPAVCGSKPIATETEITVKFRM